MNVNDQHTPRDSRDNATVIYMDLSAPTDEIDRTLHARFEHARGLWWELETDEKTGWVYDASSYILAKLVHVSGDV